MDLDIYFIAVFIKMNMVDGKGLAGPHYFLQGTGMILAATGGIPAMGELVTGGTDWIAKSLDFLVIQE